MRRLIPDGASMGLPTVMDFADGKNPPVPKIHIDREGRITFEPEPEPEVSKR